MKFLTVDKIEKGSHADCEDDMGIAWTIDICDLPLNAREGSILVTDKNGKWIVDDNLTKQIKKEKK